MAVNLVAGYSFGTISTDDRLWGLVTTSEVMETIAKVSVPDQRLEGQIGGKRTAILISQVKSCPIVGSAAHVPHFEGVDRSRTSWSWRRREKLLL